MPVFNIYGYTGGHKSRVSANRTESLLRAVLDELKSMPESPCLILGDFNAEPSDLPTFRNLTSLGWTDLGASAALWNQLPDQPTCKAPNPGSRATVRDYILASPLALPFVSNFSVAFEDTFVTHAVLRCTLDFTTVRDSIRKLSTPSSLAYMVQQSFIRKFHIVCAENAQQHCSGSSWAEHLDQVTLCMDSHFDCVMQQIESLCLHGCTDDAWLLWSNAFELAVLHYCDNVDGAMYYRGHGVVRTHVEVAGVCPKIASNGTLLCSSENTFPGHVRKQYNRMVKLAEYMRALRPTTAINHNTLQKAQHTLTAIKTSAASHLSRNSQQNLSVCCSEYDNLSESIIRALPAYIDDLAIRFLPSVTNLASELNQLVEKLACCTTSHSFARHYSAHHKAALTKRDFSKLKQACSLPLRCLRFEDETGREQFEVDPARIDGKLREVWGPIREGKIHKSPELVYNYFR